MSGDDIPNSRIGPIGPMYIVDFLDYLKARNLTSWREALTIIQVTRRYGPGVAKAEMIGEESCRVRTHIGYGLDAVIEMDKDREGKWEPVLGEIVKR